MGAMATKTWPWHPPAETFKPTYSIPLAVRNTKNSTSETAPLREYSLLENLPQGMN